MKEGSELSDSRVIVDKIERDVMHGELSGAPNGVEDCIPDPRSLQTNSHKLMQVTKAKFTYLSPPCWNRSSSSPMSGTFITCLTTPLTYDRTVSAVQAGGVGISTCEDSSTFLYSSSISSAYSSNET